MHNQWLFENRLFDFVIIFFKDKVGEVREDVGSDLKGVEFTYYVLEMSQHSKLVGDQKSMMSSP